MMRKAKLILLLLLILIPIKVNAASLELICPATTKPDSEINCNISTSDSLKGLKILFSLPNEITTTKVTTNWKNYYKGTKGLVVTKNISDDFSSDITLKVSEQASLGTEYNIGLIGIEASDNEHHIITIDDVFTKVKILSDDNTLSNISITNGSLSPKFDKNITSYTATVKKEKTTVTATPSFSKAKVEGDTGEIILNYGVNKLNITVTSELGTSKTYSITITRPMPIPEKPNSNNNNKPNSQNNNDKNDNKTSSNSNNNTNAPSTSTNTPTTAQKSNDASLKDIKIKDHKIEFNPKKYSYKIKVKNSETTIDITSTPNNSKAKVEIDKPETLEVGDNSIIITITAEDGTICKYEIIVTREKEKTKTKNIDTTEETIKSNKKISIFPSIPLAILILIIILIILILFIIMKRIFKKDE